MALLSSFMPKTILQLPNFKPYKQRTGMVIINSGKPKRPARSSGKPPQTNRDSNTSLGSLTSEKQLDNNNKVIIPDDGSSKKSKSSS